jgi:DNA polymerase I-like protein with 3'-5' exonuclease and polymerase domains
LAKQLESTVDEANAIKKAYLKVLPGVADLIKGLKQRAKNDEPIITWGGRVYYVEPPKMVDGRLRTFDYKLLNYLCQGSAADLTKAAIVEYRKRAEHGRIIITVHDQIVITVPKKHWKSEAKILRSCMEDLPLDAKLLADGSVGPNLHNLEDFK